jgi:hypothetical protein
MARELTFPGVSAAQWRNPQTGEMCTPRALFTMSSPAGPATLAVLDYTEIGGPPGILVLCFDFGTSYDWYEVPAAQAQAIAAALAGT